MHSPLGLTLASSLLVLSLAHSGSAEAQPYPPREQVLGEMEARCERVRAGKNPFFGDHRLHELERRLQVPASDPSLQIADLSGFAYEMIRTGDHARALEAITSATQILGDDPAPQVLRDLKALEGIAHLQMAEDRNCLSLHTQASCIVPLRPEGVHTEPEHARKAGDAFLSMLEDGDERADTRWLLNLSRMVSGDWPDGVPARWRLPTDAFAPRSEAGSLPFFLDVASRLGIHSNDTAGGAVMDDFDGDGLLDLVSSTSDPCGSLKAWRNDGQGGFEDVTSEWGLDAQLGGLNLMHADYDNDGRLDLLVLRGAWYGHEGRVRNSLLRNDLDGEAGQFIDVTSIAGLAYPAYPTQTAGWADFDLDGDLDLFIGNEASDVNADPQALDPLSPGYPSQLFQNNGDGTFTDVAKRVGIVDRGYTKAVAWGDYDNDGDPDLYLSNLGPNRLFRNERAAGFRDVTAEVGVEGFGSQGEPKFTFVTWFFDYDDDGDLDLFIAPYNGSPRLIAAFYLDIPPAPDARDLDTAPILYRNDGGSFLNVASEVGLDEPALVMGANFGDLDGDGRLDLYLGTGQPGFSALMPNLAYRNTEAGFRNVTFDIGLGHLQKAHGVAFGDLDNDGFEELFHQLGGAYPYDGYTNALFVAPERSGHWVVLRLRGTNSNHFAIGARIHLQATNGDRLRSVHRRVGTGGSFGGSSLQQEIALGDATAIERVEVRWPSGSRSTYTGLELDRFFQLTEGETEARPLAVSPIELKVRPQTDHSGSDHQHSRQQP